MGITPPSPEQSMSHPDAVRRILDRLLGQWIEAVDSATPDDPGPAGMVTSRGWVLRGDIRIEADSVVTDDVRLIGAVMSGVALSTGGELRIPISDSEGTRPSEVTMTRPWSLIGPRSIGVTAAPDGSIGVHEGTGRRIATDAAMEQWRAAEPTAAEISLLDAADDDWLSPADVVSYLVSAGVSDGAEIAVRGIDLMARLVARGDVVAGHVGADGFRPDGADPADVIEHIATVWRALAPRKPAPGQIAWFDLTDAGTQRLMTGRGDL